jgi:hypothetical protein
MPIMDARYEVVESTSSRLVFRQQYFTNDLANMKWLNPRAAGTFPATKVLQLVFSLLFCAMIVIEAFLAFVLRFSMTALVIPFLVTCLIIIGLIIRFRLLGIGYQSTTTLDKDRGTIEIDGDMISKSGERLKTKFNRHERFPLASTTTFSTEPVWANRKYDQTNTLHGLRLSCSNLQPVFVFQSTNVEFVTDLKRLVDEFLQGGGPSDTS